MAKDRHRIFEIYPSRDEAAWELMPKGGNLAKNAAASEAGNFKHLAVLQLAGITQVQFRETDLSGHERSSELQDDLAQLADKLVGNSRVLFDFTGVQLFGSAGINALIAFEKKLKVRGSRMVLCCLESDVRAAFFLAH